VLVYHKVDPKAELGLTCVHPDTFEKQIAFLTSEGYQLVTLSDLRLNGNNKRIAICFDDGYQDVYDYAFPVLQKYSAVATVFIIVGYIGKDNTWDVNIGGIRYRHLDEDSIHKLVESGWEIGSHSMSHRPQRFTGRREMEFELGQSKKILETKFKQIVTAYAPPFGIVTRCIYDYAFSAGYQNICGFFPFRYYAASKPKKSEILRLAVYRTDSLASIKRKLSEGNNLYCEVLKQNVVNFCSNATLAVNSLR